MVASLSRARQQPPLLRLLWGATAARQVVHVYRMENENGEEEIIRIISAREANKHERRIYVQQSRE